MKKNWTNLFEGNAGAFLGEDIGEAGLIDGSDQFFNKSFEKGNKLGSLEQVYLVKIKICSSSAVMTKPAAYAEIIGGKLKDQKEITENEVTTRFDKLAQDGWMTKIRAQVLLGLEARGITSSVDLKNLNIPKMGGLGTYSNLDEYISDHARAAG